MPLLRVALRCTTSQLPPVVRALCVCSRRRLFQDWGNLYPQLSLYRLHETSRLSEQVQAKGSHEGQRSYGSISQGVIYADKISGILARQGRVLIHGAAHLHALLGKVTLIVGASDPKCERANRSKPFAFNCGSGGVIALALSGLSYVGRLRRPRSVLAGHYPYASAFGHKRPFGQ